jgi:hypothetical protein
MPQLFPDDVAKAAFIRSDGECECVKNSHKHHGRCNNLMTFNMRGVDLPGGWEAVPIDTGGPPVLSNCQAICRDCLANVANGDGS